MKKIWQDEDYKLKPLTEKLLEKAEKRLFYFLEDTHLLAGRDFIYDEMASYRYRLWFDTFFQTNPLQAKTRHSLPVMHAGD